MDNLPTQEKRSESGWYMPLDLGKLIAGSFNIYREYFGPLLLMVLVLQLPPILLLLRYSYVLHPVMAPDWYSRGAPLPPGVTWEGIIGVLVGMALYSLLTFPYLLIVPARIAGMRLMNREITLGEAIRFASKRWLVTQATYALWGGLIVLLFLLPLMVMMLALVEGLEFAAIGASVFVLILAFFATLYLIIRIAPMNGAVAFDDPQGSFFQRAVSNLTHTFRLTRRSFWYVTGVWFTIVILAEVARYVLVQPIALGLWLLALWQDMGSVNPFTFAYWQPPLWYTSASLVLRMLGYVVTLPFEQIMAALLFFDLRFKLEGLDLKLNLAMLEQDKAAPEEIMAADTAY
jgi:hypothetical protein